MNKKEKNYTLHEGTVIPFALWLTTFGLLGLFATVFVYYFRGHINSSGKIDTALIGTFGDFIGGFFGTIFSLVTVFLVWLAYQSQKKELAELGKQGKEQIEIQALSALIIHYENTIKNLSSNLGAYNKIVDVSEEHKNRVNETFQNLIMYTSLLEFTVNELTNRVKVVKDYRETFQTNQNSSTNI